MEAIERFIILLILAAVVAVVARRVGLAYALALLLLGLGLGAANLIPTPALSSRMILLLFLPPLLFEAAFALDLPLLWNRRRGVSPWHSPARSWRPWSAGRCCTGLLAYPEYVAWGIGAALAGRAAVAYGLTAIIHPLGVDLPWPERHVLFWDGLRGAVALSLPPTFPARAQLLALTYGVVLFTVLIQGLTIGPLVRRLGLVLPRDDTPAHH